MQPNPNKHAHNIEKLDKSAHIINEINSPAKNVKKVKNCLFVENLKKIHPIQNEPTAFP